MAFLVGWHYVKQEYGILMVDAVLKRNFFTKLEKKLLMANSYACWLATWIYGNRVVESNDYFSLTYYTFDIPDVFFYAAGIAAALTTALVLASFASRLFRRESGEVTGLPSNGVVPYLTSVYLWMMFVRANPLVILIVPAFHSLQYLLVVWRYQLNLENSRPDGAAHPVSGRSGAIFERWGIPHGAFRASWIGLGIHRISMGSRRTRRSCQL